MKMLTTCHRPSRILVLLFLFVTAISSYAQAPSEDELRELEHLIEQQEMEQAEAKRKAEEEAKRKTEEQRRIELEKQRAEEEARKQAEEARKRLEEETRIKAEAEKKEKYSLLIKEAEQAIRNKDKELALNKYTEALELNPGDPVAGAGMKEAEKLMDKTCYEVLGPWEWSRGIGKDTMVLREDGSIDYRSIVAGSGLWSCVNPDMRQFKIMVSAGGFSNEWIASLSKDGTCLDAAHGGCFRRPGTESDRNQTQEKQKQQLPF